ncbi:MarR family winged helix-turn-helix transcriptional regulator [Streptomyces qinzhouensis]|uniref:Winged helix-turn-helix transcriptional regulator n=1 Tax=Streptomyces qinzhouensis TaxID=2599401 RepID=A0A5B8JEG1_9ACTN|nr:MarR family winged helix-turn-helix transcriptional regulator [Streptomyces qinzhouensis]QDY76170.1 winged helix-turn-helix transcriptional regulator [Streptomyces qinzhouensis]
MTTEAEDVTRAGTPAGAECAGAADGTGPSAPDCTGGGADYRTGPVCDEKAPVSFTVSRVARLHRMASGKLLRGLGLYPGQEFVMVHLWTRGPSRQSDLIKAADLDPSTVTKMLQRLEQAGHVRRCPDPADRRAVLVEATDSSGELRTAVEATLAGLEEHLLTGLDEGERRELLRLLAKAELNLCREAGECNLPE